MKIAEVHECSCGNEITVRMNGCPTFCENCKIMYWLQDGELQIRWPVPVKKDGVVL